MLLISTAFKKAAGSYHDFVIYLWVLNIAGMAQTFSTMSAFAIGLDSGD